jgi:hypothetical protein
MKIDVINWMPLSLKRGRVGRDKKPDELPGKRGIRLIFLPDLIGDRYVHFSWLGEAFCVRDYLGGREFRQAQGLTASDIWRMHQGPVFSAEKHSYEDADFWKEQLRRVTDEVLRTK